jgi:hypothetical protein
MVSDVPHAPKFKSSLGAAFFHIMFAIRFAAAYVLVHHRYSLWLLPVTVSSVVLPPSVRERRAAMKDYLASIEKLRREAAETALIRDLTTDRDKRETYSRLHDHLIQLAEEIERAMRAAAGPGPNASI